MKLKKIASLMLAGIMAVSMLAACGEGKGNSSSSSSSSTPVATGFVAEVENAIKVKNSTLKIDVKASTPMDTQLKALFAMEENTDESLKANNYMVILNAVNTAFGWNINNTDNNMATKELDEVNAYDALNNTDEGVTSYMFAIVNDVTKVSNTTAQVAAANKIAAYFEDVKNEVGSRTTATNVSYTLYVSQQTATTAKGDSVPYFIALLEMKSSPKL